MPTNFDNVLGEPSLIILDYLLIEIYTEDVCVLFTRVSNHRNISVILINQILFHQGRYCRDIYPNDKYWALFKNVRDKRQFSHLANQVLPEDSTDMFKAYLDATRRAHGYLKSDLTQDSEDRHRLRTNFFAHEYPPVIYVAIDDKTHKGEISHSTRSKKGKPKLWRAIISEGGKELFNSRNGGVFNVLNGNIPLSTCLKRKLKKLKATARRLAISA